MKEYNKHFAFLLFVCVICFLISFDLINYSQAKNNNKDQSHNRSFVGSWNEEKAREVIIDICKEWMFKGMQEDYTIGKSLSYQKNGIQKRFVQISRNGESCHFCPGLIGAVIFSENNNSWYVEFEDETFAKFGYYGIPPDGKLIKIGSDWYGLLFQFWRMQKGSCRDVEEGKGEGYVICSGGYVHDVAIIDLRDKKYSLILREKIYQTEEDFTNQAPVIPKVEATSTSNSDFYSIKINTKIYKFKEEKYKVLGK